MHRFINKESYKHKYAKEIFKQWCDTKDFFETNYNTNISWYSNRSENAWLEYPIVVNSHVNSVDQNWDEIWPGLTPRDKRFFNNYVPTYAECKEYDLIPISVVDIVLTHKGRPCYFIEICHTNPVSDEKLLKLKQAGVFNLIEIDAEWIITQTERPSKIEIKRWLI